MAGRRWQCVAIAFHPKRNERESCEETEDTGFCAARVEIEGHERDAAFFLYSRRIRRTKRRTTWCWPSSSRPATWAWCPSFDTASTCPIYRRNRIGVFFCKLGRGLDPAASVEGARIRYARFPRNKKKKKKKKRESERNKRVIFVNGSFIMKVVRINQDWINFFSDIAISIRWIIPLNRATLRNKRIFDQSKWWISISLKKKKKKRRNRRNGRRIEVEDERYGRKKEKERNYKHAKSTHDPLSSRSLIPFPLGLLDVPT